MFDYLNHEFHDQIEDMNHHENSHDSYFQLKQKYNSDLHNDSEIFPVCSKVYASDEFYPYLPVNDNHIDDNKSFTSFQPHDNFDLNSLNFGDINKQFEDQDFSVEPIPIDNKAITASTATTDEINAANYDKFDKVSIQNLYIDSKQKAETKSLNFHDSHQKDIKSHLETEFEDKDYCHDFFTVPSALYDAVEQLQTCRITLPIPTSLEDTKKYKKWVIANAHKTIYSKHNLQRYDKIVEKDTEFTVKTGILKQFYKNRNFKAEEKLKEDIRKRDKKLQRKKIKTKSVEKALRVLEAKVIVERKEVERKAKLANKNIPRSVQALVSKGKRDIKEMRYIETVDMVKQHDQKIHTFVSSLQQHLPKFKEETIVYKSKWQKISSAI